MAVVVSACQVYASFYWWWPEQTVVDLRRMDRPCKQSVNVHERRLRKLWHDIRMVGPLIHPLAVNHSRWSDPTSNELFLLASCWLKNTIVC